jgi:single-strand DNA-binding protein
MLKIEILGNIGNDAQIKNFNGKNYIAFNVAHSEKFKNQQGVETERTTWVSVLYPGEGAIVQYLKKGTGVFVRGDMSVKQFQDSGHNWQVGVNCLAREVQLCPGGKRDQNQQQPGQATAPAQQPAPATNSQPAKEAPAEGGTNDDLPF